MAAAAIDTAIRNAICAGASRDYLAILDNFCWSSSNTPERLFELKEAARACYDIATAYGTPFISGKDSMFNNFRGFDEEGADVHIAALPTLLISAIGVMPDIRKAMTIDFKHVGDLVYVLGATHEELGASEYYTMLDAKSGIVPAVDTTKNAKVYEAVANAISANILASAIGVGRGGLGVALAKSALAGQLGARIELSRMPGNAKKAQDVLFSESQGRILVSVRSSDKQAFEALMNGCLYTNVGEIIEAPLLSLKFGAQQADLGLDKITTAYRSFFKDW